MNTTTDITETLNAAHGIENGLQFLQDEIKIMRTRLVDLAAKENSQSAMPQVEHFQNQFIVQANNVQELLHAWNENEGFLQNDVAQGRNVSVTLIDRRETLTGEYAVLKNIVDELRREFKLFVGSLM